MNSSASILLARLRHRVTSLGLLFVALFAAVATVHAQANPPEVQKVRDAAIAAEARFDSAAALKLYLEIDTLQPNQAAVLQKISRQYSDLTLDTPDVAEKRRLCQQALAYAQRAVALAPNDPVNLLSLAICYGKLATYADTRTKLEHSKRVKQYAEQSLQLDPSYDYAYHVLGRWNYEVASLGSATRLIVRLVYGGLPPASTAEAVRLLQRAVALSPHLPAHQVELGFALLADGQREAACDVLEKALRMPKREKYDDEGFARARRALEKTMP